MATETTENPLAFSCSCGSLRGYLTSEGAQAGTHVACHCADCRANEVYHNLPDPAPEPVRLLQISPEAITITQGAEHLRVLRLTRRGIFRWYAGCCGTPIANTLASAKLPFAGMRTALFENPDHFGKIRVEAFVPQPGKPPRTKGALPMVLSLFKRMGAARLSGRWRDTPFFDAETGEPVAAVEVLSKDARAALPK